jgi:hypothetical protein
MKNDYRGLPLFAIETHLNALNEHWIGKGNRLRNIGLIGRSAMILISEYLSYQPHLLRGFSYIRDLIDKSLIL